MVQEPADFFTHPEPPGSRNIVQEQPLRVGSPRNRVDIVDLTAATTFLLSDCATVATGFSFPLLGDDNRAFDWEFHLQVNYYFGACGRRLVPNY
jgi:hypothetical protein